MLLTNGRSLSKKFALCLLMSSVGGCINDHPPVVTGDLSCERFRHISASDAQITVFVSDLPFWKSYIDQVAAHNTEYDKACQKTK